MRMSSSLFTWENSAPTISQGGAIPSATAKSDSGFMTKVKPPACGESHLLIPLATRNSQEPQARIHWAQDLRIPVRIENRHSANRCRARNRCPRIFFFTDQKYAEKAARRSVPAAGFFGMEGSAQLFGEGVECFLVQEFSPGRFSLPLQPFPPLTRRCTCSENLPFVGYAIALQIVRQSMR